MTCFVGDECSEDDEDEKTEDRAFMMWPFTVAHRIDKRSPLYNLGPKELLASKFEMVVTLEGIVEPTGNSVQARTSYLPNELLWGHRYRLSFLTPPQGLSCTVQIW